MAAKLLVDSTHRSGPAPRGNARSASRQSDEPSTLTSAATFAFRRRASRTASITSMVSPLWEKAITSAPAATKSLR